LKPAPINPDWILEGSPTARNAQLASSGDRQSRTLVWDCSAGKFMWRYDEDETIHILKGLVVLDDGVGTPRELGPGDVVFFPAGAVVKWHVKEHVRKLAFFRRALPRPIILALGAMRRLRRLARRATAVRPERREHTGVEWDEWQTARPAAR